jgi:hypothetical protein
VHPIDFVESLLAENECINEVQLSVYRYHPQSVTEERTPYEVRATQLRASYERFLERLKEGEDISFDSVVRMCGKTRSKKHFAFLDFQTAHIKRIEEAAELLVAEYHEPRAVLVHSGRSYHLYMGVLLPHPAWVRFMGRILLLNVRGEPPTVDPRWVGHRLVGGYGALRWSAKANPNMPYVIRKW